MTPDELNPLEVLLNRSPEYASGFTPVVVPVDSDGQAHIQKMDRIRVWLSDSIEGRFTIHRNKVYIEDPREAFMFQMVMSAL